MKVSILNNGGKIRLKYRVHDKYQFISLGLDYTPSNLKIAKAKAAQIESDIIFNKYESTTKYEINPKPKTELWNFPKILEYYSQHKQHDSTTLDSIRILNSWCDRSPIRLLFPNRLDEWVLFLKEKIERLDSKGYGYKDSTIFLHFKILRASIYFAKDMGKITDTLIVSKVCKTITVPNTKEVKIYSSTEINSIIQHFYNSVEHCFYAPIIHFRFLTGCRPSEAIALTWDDLIEKNNKMYIVFNKRFTKGELKLGLKNKKPYRYFPCNDSLKDFFTSIPKTNTLIFPSPTGTYLNSDLINKRHWNPLIQLLVETNILPFKIPFYDERHCFGTLICRQVNDLKTISSIMGNSPATLQKHYLADDFNLDLPDLY